MRVGASLKSVRSERERERERLVCELLATPPDIEIHYDGVLTQTVCDIPILLTSLVVSCIFVVSRLVYVAHMEHVCQYDDLV